MSSNGTTWRIKGDEVGNCKQREIIDELVLGKHGGGYFEIFASVMSTELGPVYAAIEIDADRERRVGSVRIGDLAESTIEPIRNPVTGDEHRVRIDLPDGFEYKQAEIGNTVEARVPPPSRCRSRSRTSTRS